MTRAKDISKIVTDANLSGTLDVTGAFTSQGIDDNANATAITIDSSEDVTLSGNLSTGVNKFINIRDADGHVSGRLRNVSGSNNALTIEADPDNSASSTFMSFKIDTTERMRIDESGNVGIGTTDPSQKLDVNGTIVASTISSQGARIERNGTTGGANFDSVLASGSLHFRTGATERMRIDSSGNVGIGTSSPSARLTVSELASTTLATFDSTSARMYFGINNTATSYFDVDTLIFRNSPSSGATERMRINANGQLAIGSSTTRGKVTVNVDSASADGIYLDNANGGASLDIAMLGSSYNSHGANAGEVWFYSPDNINIGGATGNSNAIKFLGGGTERMRITSGGNVGIGVTPSFNLHVFQSGPLNSVLESDTGNSNLRITSGDGDSAQIFFGDQTNDTISIIKHDNSDNSLAFFTAGNNQRVRIDSSGRLLLGTTTEGESSADDLTIATTGNTGITIRSGTSGIGNLYFSDGTSGADEYRGYLQYHHSSNLMVFGTDTVGRMYITSDGHLLVGKSARGFNTNGVELRNGLSGIDSHFTVDGGTVCSFNRKSSDGAVVNFGQDGTVEGQINIAGTTTSYLGGHLSRWSRLLNNSKDTTLVKGTVMTNLNEMVEWGDEDNEQLNKMAVSSVEGDANVAGVFVNWDNDDDWNDMNIAMTGDMVIRIAQGTTVARGDLLMSAGDGTAKPQDDDIVRSKTIAKVTSTNVSHTYDDGTYLVPCVLMAC